MNNGGESNYAKKDRNTFKLKLLQDSLNYEALETTCIKKIHRKYS